MAKKAQKTQRAPRRGKGNGGDEAGEQAAAQTKKQLDFLNEVKKLAKEHGIPIGAGPAGAMPPKRDLRIQVKEQNGQIIVDFGRTAEGQPNSISWMALSPEQATKFAATMIKIVQNIQSIKASGGEALTEDPPDEDEAEKKSEVDKPK